MTDYESLEIASNLGGWYDDFKIEKLLEANEKDILKACRIALKKQTVK